MADGTRLPDGGAGALAVQFEDRLQEFDALVDALLALRQQYRSMTDEVLAPETAESDPPFDARDVAEILGVKTRTVSQWTFRRRLPEPDLVRHSRKLWRRSTILRWAGDTGRLSNPDLREEYERIWRVPPAPYRQGGRIPEPPWPQQEAERDDV